MDRGTALARFLSGAALLLCLAGAADAPPLPIAEARWLAPGSLEAGLTSAPAECLALPADLAERQAAAIGRVAFRAPLLLGGQAARAGLSCTSCHRNGRGNPHFSFPGLSGDPGTADITSSLMSKHRGDGTVNPKPIPDLASSTPVISRDRESRALERFIHGLIVEEFDGPEPAPAILSGLAAYVRAMAPAACRDGPEPVTLTNMLAEADQAVALAAVSTRKGDIEAARLLIASARSSLGRIDERFRLPGLETGRAILAEADHELRLIRQAATAGAIAAWQEKWRGRRQRLKAQEARTLFAPAILRLHLPAAPLPSAAVRLRPG